VSLISNLSSAVIVTFLVSHTTISEKRIKEYTETIAQNAKQSNLEPELVAAVIQVESSWYPKAVSEAGACGLMQVIPKWNPKKDGSLYTCEELKDPKTNIKVGTKALRWWMDRAKGDRELALCAYNAGYICFKKMRYSYVKRVMNVYYTIKSK
jgi:soluble lytic murein transglycosylase-like protein